MECMGQPQERRRKGNAWVLWVVPVNNLRAVPVGSPSQRPSANFSHRWIYKSLPRGYGYVKDARARAPDDGYGFVTPVHSSDISTSYL